MWEKRIQNVIRWGPLAMTEAGTAWNPRPVRRRAPFPVRPGKGHCFLGITIRSIYSLAYIAHPTGWTTRSDFARSITSGHLTCLSHITHFRSPHMATSHHVRSHHMAASHHSRNLTSCSCLASLTSSHLTRLHSFIHFSHSFHPAAG